MDFPFCGQVACVERHTEEIKTGKKRSEIVYLITSASPEKVSPKQLLELNRGHWAIENKSHYVRDRYLNQPPAACTTCLVSTR